MIIFSEKSGMNMRRSNIAKMSDSQLVWLYAETRGKEYFGELFLRYIPLLYGLCLKSFSDRSSARGGVMLLFEKLSEQLLAEAEIVGEFRDWVYEKAVDYVGAPKISAQDKDEEECMLSYAGIEYLDRLRSGDQAAYEALEAHSGRMTKPQRECVKSFFVDKKSFADISRETGYLTDNVKSYIIKGIESVAGSGTGDDENNNSSV